MKIKASQIQILGLLILALLFVLTIPIFADRIPSTLQTHLTKKLVDQGYDWVRVGVQGRNVTLSGNAPTAKDSFAVLGVIEKYTPIVRIRDQITPRIIQPYSMKMAWDGKQLLLNGYIPDQSSYDDFLKSAYQLLDKNKIQGHLMLGAGAPENWQQIIKTSLQQLLKLKQGNLEITNYSLYFAGQTPYLAKRNEITQSFSQYKQYERMLNIVANDENNIICQAKFKKLLDNSNIKFTSGKATLDKSSYPLLTKLANIASLCSQSIISIEGHTDNLGSEATNLKLSQQRARAVMNWLFQQGIAEQQLSAIGYGSQRPIADNDTEEGRAINRRIEFVVKAKGDQ